MSSNTVSVKLIVSDNDIRRIAIPKDTHFEGLVNAVSTILPNTNTCTLNYLDDEADVCTITNTVELQEAFSVSSQSGRILRLLLNQSTRGPALPQEARKKQKRPSRFSHRSSSLYALARRQALAGNTEAALDFLEKSIRYGFRDTNALLTDPSFDCLKSLAAFETLVFESKIQNQSKPISLSSHHLHSALMCELRLTVPVKPCIAFSHSKVETGHKQVMCEITNNKKPLRHQPEPSVNPSQLFGRVGLMRQIEGRASAASAKTQENPSLHSALMSELQSRLTSRDGPCILATDGSKPETPRLVQVMKELIGHPPQLNHCEVPIVNPSQVHLTGRQALMSQIQSPDSKTSLKTVPVAATAKLPLPGRFGFLSVEYSPLIALPGQTAHQALMREIKARVPLLKH